MIRCPKTGDYVYGEDNPADSVTLETGYAFAEFKLKKKLVHEDHRARLYNLTAGKAKVAEYVTESHANHMIACWNYCIDILERPPVNQKGE